MRLLVLSENFPPRKGGSSVWLWNLYTRLSQHAVLFAAGECEDDLAFDLVSSQRILRLPLTLSDRDPTAPRAFLPYWRLFWRVVQNVRREGIEQIHCGKVLPEGFIAFLIKLFLRTPYVVFCHGEEITTTWTSRRYRLLVPMIYKGAARLIANASNTARLLREIGIAEGKIEVLKPSVDAEAFRNAASLAEDVRARHGLGQAPVLVTVGRLQRRKGHDTVIAALPAILERFPETTYLIVGDGSERTRLEELARVSGVANRVVFAGIASDEELPGYYGAGDIFIMPNREVAGDFEGFGIVFLEAAACRKAVIAGASGGVREAVIDEETGILVDGTRQDAVSAAVIRLLEKPHLAQAMGLAAEERVRKEFSYSRAAADLERVVTELVGGVEGPPMASTPAPFQGVSRRRVALNLASNQVGFFLPAIITFVLSPFVVHSLGDGLYGLWSLVVSFSGHYGLLTLGVQSAATRYVAHAAGTRDAPTLNRYVNAGLYLLLPAAILSIVAGSVLAFFLEPLFHIRPDDLSPAAMACVLMALTMGVTFATAIFSSILTAFQRFDSLNIVKVSATIVRSLFTVWLLLEGHGIVALAVLSLVIAAASGLGFAGLARLQCPGWKLSRSAADKASVKTLLAFGGKSLVGTAALALIYQTDLFVIGLFLGTEEITTYSLASTLLFYVLQFVNSIVHVLDPYATERYARGGVAGIRDLFVEGSAFVYALGGVVVGCALAFSKPFFAIWIDPEHVASGTILAILVVPQFFDMGARFGHSFLVGMGSIGRFNAVALAGGVLNLVLSLGFVRIWGIEGVAIGTLIPMILVNAVWFIPYIARVLGVRPARIYFGSVAPGLLVALVTWGVGGAVQRILEPTGWASLTACLSVTLAASGAACWVVLPKQVAGMDWRRKGLALLEERIKQLSPRNRHA